MVYSKSNFKCVCCDRKFIPDKNWNTRDALHDGEMFLEIDHIKPLSKGGSDKIENKQSLCQKCNNRKSDHYEEN